MKARDGCFAYGRLRRKGFTLIELVVAMGILIIVIYMSLAAFGYIGASSKAQQSREAALESAGTVLDQVTKELRQCMTKTSSGLEFDAPYGGIPYPLSGTTRDVWNILDASSPSPGTGGAYVFDTSKGPILQFYSIGDDGSIYRISYTLGVPVSGALAQRYWADVNWVPCQVLYTRERWTDSNSNGIPDSGEFETIVANQAITDQVVTDLVVVRPSWSKKVVQIAVRMMLRDAAGRPSEVTRIAEVALRQ